MQDTYLVPHTDRSAGDVRGRADKFCLHLNRKWTRKDILMK
jgi:hypothetical protein